VLTPRKSPSNLRSKEERVWWKHAPSPEHGLSEKGTVIPESWFSTEIKTVVVKVLGMSSDHFNFISSCGPIYNDVVTG
jgi:fumarate reductase subunit C